MQLCVEEGRDPAKTFHDRTKRPVALEAVSTVIGILYLRHST